MSESKVTLKLNFSGILFSDFSSYDDSFVSYHDRDYSNSKERGGRGKGGWGVKNFFPHPNQLLIWAYTENLVKIGLVVEAPDEFCGTGREGTGGHGTERDSIGRSGLKLGASKA